MLDSILCHLPSDDKRNLCSTCQTLRRSVLASFVSLRVDRKPTSPAEEAFLSRLSGVRHVAASNMTLADLRAVQSLPKLVSLSLSGIMDTSWCVQPSPLTAKVTALRLFYVPGPVLISAPSALLSLHVEGFDVPHLEQLVQLQRLHLATVSRCDFWNKLTHLTKLSYLSVSTQIEDMIPHWTAHEDAYALRALKLLPALRVLDYGQPAHGQNLPELASLARLTALNFGLSNEARYLDADLSALPGLQRLGIEVFAAGQLEMVHAPTVTCLFLLYEHCAGFFRPILADGPYLPDLTRLTKMQHMMLHVDMSVPLIFEEERMPPQELCLSVQHVCGQLSMEPGTSVPSRVKYQSVSAVGFLADPETLVSI